MRVMEIMNDFRTLQHHISSLISRAQASPPDEQSYYLDGFVVLRQCHAESQAILATHYNPGNLGLQTGSVPETEVQKATLQRYKIRNALTTILTSAGSYSMPLHAVSKHTRSIYEPQQLQDGFKCATNSFEERNQMEGTFNRCDGSINIYVR